MCKNITKSQRKICFQHFYFFPWKAVVIQIGEVCYKENIKKNYKSKRREEHFTFHCNSLQWSSYIPAMSLFLTFHPSFTLWSFQKPSAAQNHAHSRALNLLHGPVYP